ncbi:MAG TPA: HD domain-containing phosphohydrolase [Solirubrobacteraceae bacterium]|nr:HD domain-containing phosphohydrolase [Solirubrobacteraceae bacterium]
MAVAELDAPIRASRPRLLCVDDEPMVLEGLRDALGRSFDVRTATSGAEGLEILCRDPDAFAVVISDMQMPGMTGTDFLRTTGLIAPDAVRLLLTGQADVDVAILAVNSARLFRFLTKPCESQELLRACAAALAHHHQQAAERMLLEETVRGCVAALAEVLALSNPAAFARGGRLKELAGKLARAAGVRNWWEVEVAAMLAPIGAVTLPAATAERLYAGVCLTAQETAMARRVPIVTRELLSKIPRLEGVVEILETHEHAVVDDRANGESRSAAPGAHVLRVAVDYAELESQCLGAAAALGVLRGRGAYDRWLLDVLASVVRVGEAPPVSEVRVSDLRRGMTLAADVRSVDGTLLMARGQNVSERLVERLANLGYGSVREPLRVFEARTAGADG